MLQTGNEIELSTMLASDRLRLGLSSRLSIWINLKSSVQLDAICDTQVAPNQTYDTLHVLNGLVACLEHPRSSGVDKTTMDGDLRRMHHTHPHQCVLPDFVRSASSMIEELEGHLGCFG